MRYQLNAGELALAAHPATEQGRLASWLRTPRAKIGDRDSVHVLLRQGERSVLQPDGASEVVTGSDEFLLVSREVLPLELVYRSLKTSEDGHAYDLLLDARFVVDDPLRLTADLRARHLAAGAPIGPADLVALVRGRIDVRLENALDDSDADPDSLAIYPDEVPCVEVPEVVTRSRPTYLP